MLSRMCDDGHRMQTCWSHICDIGLTQIVVASQICDNGPVRVRKVSFSPLMENRYGKWIGYL